jgi:energy-coupling factor transport system substrate-specific component
VTPHNSQLPIRNSQFALLASVLVGALAFLWPLWGGSADSLLLLALCSAVTLFVTLGGLQSHELNSKGLALLAVLTALNASLRLLPSFAGASPIFFLLIVTGFVFGTSFGFLFGALTMFVSAIITGGVGPWLPYQMLVAAWVGMSAGWLGGLLRRYEAHNAATLALLALFGAIWGLLYGALTDLQSWVAALDFSALPGDFSARLAALWQDFIGFYLLTSLAWDGWRAVLNVILILTLGGATLKTLYRFRRRFYFTTEQ